MRRHARALPLGRRRLGSLLGGLFLQPTENWPQHLRLAWTILIYELNISERTAIAVMASSVERANSCGQSISRLAGDIARFRSREQLVRRFKSVSKCVNRASSALRRRLDQVIVPLVQQGNIDLETIEGIFDNAVKVFDEYGIRTVRRWITNKELVAHHFGRAVRVADGDLRTFLASHRGEET